MWVLEVAGDLGLEPWDWQYKIIKIFFQELYLRVHTWDLRSSGWQWRVHGRGQSPVLRHPQPQLSLQPGETRFSLVNTLDARLSLVNTNLSLVRCVAGSLSGGAGSWAATWPATRSGHGRWVWGSTIITRLAVDRDKPWTLIRFYYIIIFHLQYIIFNPRICYSIPLERII